MTVLQSYLHSCSEGSGSRIPWAEEQTSLGNSETLSFFLLKKKKGSIIKAQKKKAKFEFLNES
jgi:hypothetical protein